MGNVVKKENEAMRTARLGFRVTHRQEILIRRAAEATRKSVTEFVLNSACSAAENALLDQKLFFADDESWQAFVDAMERSAKIKPRLGELVRHRAPWEE